MHGLGISGPDRSTIPVDRILLYKGARLAVLRVDEAGTTGYLLTEFIIPGSDVNSDNLDVFSRRYLGDRYCYTRMCGMRSRCSVADVRCVGSSGDIDDAHDGTRGGCNSGDVHAADTDHGEAAQGRDAKASETVELMLYCATSRSIVRLISCGRDVGAGPPGVHV